MRAILPLLSLSTVAQALYFYIDGTQPKCFYEELPKDTLVVGHYTAEEYDENSRSWSKHDGLSVYISVDVRFPSPITSHHMQHQKPQAPNIRANTPALANRRSSTTTTG